MLLSTLSIGQNFKSEKRIYMLDITKSMFGQAGGKYDIFDDVKNALYKGISDIKDPETIITVIPFQATHTYEILESWTFKARDILKFDKMKKAIDSYNIDTVPRGYTDIYSALEVAKRNIDIDRINYIFLLTDGEQSAVPSSPTKTYQIDFSAKNLKDSLKGWCEYSKTKDVHLFYVMLTDAAIDKEVRDIVAAQCNAYISEGTNINIAFIKPKSNQVNVNLHDSPEKLKIDLTANDLTYLPSGMTIDLELENNSIFELKNKTESLINKDKLVVHLKRKNGASFEDLLLNSPIESKLLLKLSTTNDVKILKPNISITVKNKKERVLTLEFSDDE